MDTKNDALIFSVSYKTDPGLVRSRNEDYFSLCTDLSLGKWNEISSENKVFNSGNLGSLFLVADGIGGARGGDIASKEAIKSVISYFNELSGDIPSFEFARDFLVRAIQFAHSSLNRISRQQPALSDMGTTLVGGWVYKNYLIVGWAGDSRGYLYRPQNGLTQLTKDHSVVQELLDNGRITEEQASSHRDRHVVTVSLGGLVETIPTGISGTVLQEGDRILFCSDGLNNMLTDAQIENILAKNIPVDYRVSELVELANKRGGVDNITVILAEIQKIPVWDFILPWSEVPPRTLVPEIAKIAYPSDSFPDTPTLTPQRKKRKPQFIARLSIGLIIICLIGVVAWNWPIIPRGEVVATPPTVLPVSPGESPSEQPTLRNPNPVQESNSPLIHYLEEQKKPNQQPAKSETPAKPGVAPKVDAPSTDQANLAPIKPESDIYILEKGKYYVVGGSFSDLKTCNTTLNYIAKNTNLTPKIATCPISQNYYIIFETNNYTDKNEAGARFNLFLNKVKDLKVPVEVYIACPN